ncbi:MAG: hypothetical protein B6V02_00085, partial [Thermoprotei archaeon ex4572_64]
KDKGLDILVNAFKIVKDRYSNVKLILAGDIQEIHAHFDYLNKITELINHNDIIMIRKFLTRDELQLILALSDLIVLPYIDSCHDLGVSGALHLAIDSLKLMFILKFQDL